MYQRLHIRKKSYKIGISNKVSVGMKKSGLKIFGGVVALWLLTVPFLWQQTYAAEPETIRGMYPYYAFFEDPDHPWTSVWDALDATDSYEYSDQFFAEASPGIHERLRVMSYALALAGFENKADGYPYDDAEPANPKLRKLLGELGFADYKAWDESSEDSGHSMGTSIAHKTIAYETDAGGTEAKELIVVAPRNYNYMTEWLSNFNVGETGDHAGFSESAGLVLDRIDEYIGEHSLTNYKIWIVGYSRGGAVVDLVAKRLNENIASYDMTADDLYAYTFGAPRASATEPGYTNIHDVKDGNDLLLGYLFPEAWGLHNTGIYEEIHAPDLEIGTYAINTSDLADSSRVMNLLASNSGTITEFGTVNAKDFVDEWLEFIISHGLTREYFDTTIKPPLSQLMQIYQRRTLDKQSEFTGFISDTSSSSGLLYHIAMNAVGDMMSGKYEGSTLEEVLEHFPPYLDIVAILQGTATPTEVAELADYLKTYMGSYTDYGESPAVTEDEFLAVKSALPELLKAIGPLLVADAEHTVATKGANASLYYITTVVSNFTPLVYGHTPESIMPILKSYVVEPEDDPAEEAESLDELGVPNTGEMGGAEGLKPDSKTAEAVNTMAVVVTLFTALVIVMVGAIKLRR